MRDGLSVIDVPDLAGGFDRDGAAHRQRDGRGGPRRRGKPSRARRWICIGPHLLRALRLPLVRDQHSRAGAPAVLLQLPLRRMQRLRRAGHAQGTEPGADQGRCRRHHRLSDPHGLHHARTGFSGGDLRARETGLSDGLQDATAVRAGDEQRAGHTESYNNLSVPGTSCLAREMRGCGTVGRALGLERRERVSATSSRRVGRGAGDAGAAVGTDHQHLRPRCAHHRYGDRVDAQRRGRGDDAGAGAPGKTRRHGVDDARAWCRHHDEGRQEKRNAHSDPPWTAASTPGDASRHHRTLHTTRGGWARVTHPAGPGYESGSRRGEPTGSQ